jgi:hypothetical protein
MFKAFQFGLLVVFIIGMAMLIGGSIQLSQILKNKETENTNRSDHIVTITSLHLQDHYGVDTKYNYTASGYDLKNNTITCDFQSDFNYTQLQTNLKVNIVACKYDSNCFKCDQYQNPQEESMKILIVFGVIIAVSCFVYYLLYTYYLPSRSPQKYQIKDYSKLDGLL